MQIGNGSVLLNLILTINAIKITKQYDLKIREKEMGCLKVRYLNIEGLVVGLEEGLIENQIARLKAEHELQWTRKKGNEMTFNKKKRKKEEEREGDRQGG